MIREANRGDIPWLVTAELACFGAEAWTVGMVTEEFERPGGVQLIWPSLGFAFGWLVLGELHVLHIATLPGARRQGVGSALLARLLQTQGTESAWLEVRADNAAAHALYLAHGFSDVAVRKRYYRDGADARMMRRAA